MRLVIDFLAADLCTFEVTKEEADKVVIHHHSIAQGYELHAIAMDIQTRYGRKRPSLTIMGHAARIIG